MVNPKQSPESIDNSGCLFLVVGPSGAGKDTLLAHAHRHLSEDARFHFPKRLINRPNCPGEEEHRFLSADAIEAKIADGSVGLHWRAHNLIYGIDATDLGQLEQGQHVVINASRGIIAEARQTFSNLRVFCITVNTDALESRLRARGRETDDMIAARLARAEAFQVGGDDVIFVDNSGDLGAAQDRFLAELMAPLV